MKALLSIALAMTMILATNSAEAGRRKCCKPVKVKKHSCCAPAPSCCAPSCASPCEPACSAPCGGCGSAPCASGCGATTTYEAPAAAPAAAPEKAEDAPAPPVEAQN